MPWFYLPGRATTARCAHMCAHTPSQFRTKAFRSSMNEFNRKPAYTVSELASGRQHQENPADHHGARGRGWTSNSLPRVRFLSQRQRGRLWVGCFTEEREGRGRMFHRTHLLLQARKHQLTARHRSGKGPCRLEPQPQLIGVETGGSFLSLLFKGHPPFNLMSNVIPSIPIQPVKIPLRCGSTIPDLTGRSRLARDHQMRKLALPLASPRHQGRQR